ncbi:MAG: FtsQ-type POTRA domain-containing protein [Hyphomicrobiales bacterium]|nr:MAG: FtsQ-type POTRA domain-containing protein [Hyphomicrobiales bacterium]
MQQVGAKGFANAQLVDPRQLPIPLSDLSRRARINFGHAWVLHRKIIVRAVAAGVVLFGVVGAYEAREAITAGAIAVSNMAQGEFARAGFGIAKINITGQVLTSEATILKALALEAGTSTLNFDADAALERIELIPSIKSATVRKIYPGELVVSVEEKVPMARWRIGDATYLVDENGGPVARDDGSFRELPLVVGEGAADDAMIMIRTLDRYPALTADLAALSRIGDRRWDLIFYSGLRVQLPESGVAQALNQLDMYQATGQLLDRDVNVIDMRVPGMVSLKLGDLANRAIADAAKAAKTKKPAAPVDADYETPAERAAEAKPQ